MRKIIGIDPDVEKSGFCVITIDDEKRVSVVLRSYGIYELMMAVKFIKMDAQLKKADYPVVVVEAGWLNRSNWHLHKGITINKASKMGESIGRNQQVGHDIVDICRGFGFNVIEKAPLPKTWKGDDHKITHEELTYFVPLDKKRTNQEERDATLLAWVYAGLPVRVKPIGRRL